MIGPSRMASPFVRGDLFEKFLDDFDRRHLLGARVKVGNDSMSQYSVSDGPDGFVIRAGPAGHRGAGLRAKDEVLRRARACAPADEFFHILRRAGTFRPRPR